jgi:C-terminal processing protease CtpA/Prc
VFLGLAAPAAQESRAWRDAGLASFDDVWQTVADTFYDPTFGGVDWAGARTEFRGQAEAAGSADEIRRIIGAMLARLQRSHLRLLTATEAVDRETTRAARHLETTRDARLAPGREPGDVVVTLGNLPPMPVRTDVRELTSPRGRRVGFIGFNVWMTAIDAPVAAGIDRFRDAHGLVIDLRGNPGGLAVMMSGVAGHLVAEPVVLGRMQTRQGALEFRANPRLATPDGRRVPPYRGKVAILVDELTGSTSECFAGALQDLGRARLFGRRTMGEALPALTKRLASGDVLMYVIGNFVTTKGRPLEGEGVIPDETVEKAVTSPSAGRDETLEAALRWLDGG